MEFEKVKKNNFLTYRPIPEKQGRVRGNKNIFKVGLNFYSKRSLVPKLYMFRYLYNIFMYSYSSSALHMTRFKLTSVAIYSV